MQQELVEDLSRGTSQLIIKTNELSDYYIKYFPLSQQKDLLRDYMIQKKKEDELLKLLEQSKVEVERSKFELNAKLDDLR